MNGKQQVKKWVSVSVLVVTALLSTVTNVGAIHLVDPTPAGMSTWMRFAQYQAALKNDLAALQAISDGESAGASRGLASARPVVTTAATESSWMRYAQYQAAVENDLAALEAISGGGTNLEWERFSQYLWASGVTQ